MATKFWSPGEFITPGDLRQPRTTAPVVPSQLDNPDLETAGGWTFSDPGLAIVADSRAYTGSNVIRHANTLFGVHSFTNDNVVPVVPGTVINASFFYLRETNVSGRQGVAITIQWYDSGMVLISENESGELNRGATNVWYYGAVGGIAPPGAAFAQLLLRSRNNNTGGPHAQLYDAFTWDYVQPVAQTGLVYKAVQANAGYTAAVEPVWPIVLGNTVVDNEVTWEAVLASSVTWRAVPIMKSGTVEPTWPVDVGANVLDGTVNWLAVSRRVEDVNCPNTAVVIIGASKIFAADRDIIRFSATINPLDWTTANDAGYLPYGLQLYGSNPVAAMGLYRSNLVAFNSEGFQMWQIDQDPSAMAFLDAVPVGSTEHQALQPVANDLFLLNPVGMRNLAIAGASTNLQAEGVGEEIDELVTAELEAGLHGLGLFWPGAGQYWVFFNAQAFVLTINAAKKRTWSRYVFPSSVTDWTLQGNDLYLRSGVKVWKVDKTVHQDDLVAAGFSFTAGDASPFFGWALPDVLTGDNPQVGTLVSGTATYLTNTIGYIVYRGSPASFLIYLEGAVTRPAENVFESLTLLVNGTTSIVLDINSPEFNGSIESGALGREWNFDAAVGSIADGDLVELQIGAPVGVNYTGVMWWPFLDLASLGGQKDLEAVDLVATAPTGVTISIGWNQNDRTQRTAEYAMPADTLTGNAVPFPASAPSYDLRLTFAANQLWKWNAANIYYL